MCFETVQFVCPTYLNEKNLYNLYSSRTWQQLTCSLFVKIRHPVIQLLIIKVHIYGP